MSRWTLRILAPLALLAPLAGSAEAGVGDSTGGALSSFGRLSPVQTVQYGGDCWYDNGSNGPGYYPCGNEWNNGLGWVGPVCPTPLAARDPAPSSPRRRRCASPGAETPSIPARRPAASALASRRSVYAAVWALRPLAAVHGFVNLAQPAFIRRPVSAPAPRPSPPGLPAADSTVALAAAIFISFTAPEFPTSARLSRPALLAAAVCMGLAGPQESTSSAPASPGFAGVGGFHGGGGFHGLGGATGVHIGSPASPSFAGVGTFHAGGGFHGFGGGGGAHIGAFASPGFAGGGFHGVGGAGAFQGGGAAFGQGGIGHR